MTQGTSGGELQVGLAALNVIYFLVLHMDAMTPENSCLCAARGLPVVMHNHNSRESQKLHHVTNILGEQPLLESEVQADSNSYFLMMQLSMPANGGL